MPVRKKSAKEFRELSKDLRKEIDNNAILAGRNMFLEDENRILKGDKVALHNRIANYSKLWREECAKSGELMAVKLEKQKLEHQLEVISFMTQGKISEAIQSVLRKDVLLFGIDVRFADDNSRQKAQEEMLGSVLGLVKTHLDQIKIGRNEEAKTDAGAVAQSASS
jgi:hypothetical protein